MTKRPAAPSGLPSRAYNAHPRFYMWMGVVGFNRRMALAALAISRVILPARTRSGTAQPSVHF